MKTAACSGVARFSMLIASGYALAGCGDEGRGNEGRGDEGRGDEGRGDVAGGETSEFSGGDIEGCPEIVSTTALDLQDEEVAAWVALAEGRHELSLLWRSDFVTDALSGFEEHTEVSLDVSVLAGRELEYGSGGYEGYEYAACDGAKARQLELEVALHTADGALTATFPHWVELYGSATAPGGPRMSSARVREGNGTYEEPSFTSSIELGLDAELGGTPLLGVSLDLATGSLRGNLTPFVSLPPSGSGDDSATWAPLSGIFPDDGCGRYDRAVPLDEVNGALGATPRAAYESSALRQPATYDAAWEEGVTEPYGPPASLNWTEVTVTAGAPTHACQDDDRVTIHASLGIETADGRVSLTQPATLSLGSSPTTIAGSKSRWIPAGSFQGMTGMDVDFGDGEFGAIDINHWNNDDGGIEGNLHVLAWREFESAPSTHPALRWCAGALCEAMWCAVAAGDCSEER